MKRLYIIGCAICFLLSLSVVNATFSQTCTEVSGQTERNFYDAIGTQFAYTVYVPPLL